MTVAAMVLLPSSKARSWAKVKLAKHLFEHRYDYRTEWLRFTEHRGPHRRATRAPLGERVIKAFADIVEAPGGLLLVDAIRPERSPRHRRGTGPAAIRPRASSIRSRDFWSALEVERPDPRARRASQRLGAARRIAFALPPQWMLEERRAWVGVPLIHDERLFGLVLLAAPDYRRALDWEDFDLLRTAGRQAASSLAEAHGQEALSNAQRFEEFNRRFAFILHDIKNLVSQLSLLSRNAERHADNPEFRADMVATLRSSVGKMNELLARLSPQAPVARRTVASRSRCAPILSDAIAAKRRDHEVKLLGDTSIVGRGRRARRSSRRSAI